MTKITATKKKLPFQFVLDELESLEPLIKPMFGCHAVYVGEKIVLFLYDLEKDIGEKGVWVATTRDAYASLATEFPAARVKPIEELNQSPWLQLPARAPEFEAQALHACALILQRDPRIGRVPKQKPLKSKRKQKRTKP